MATYLDMQKLAETPGAAPMLAAFLRQLDTVEWTDWERDFLDHMARRTSTDPISTRQREVLAELRDNSTWHTKTRDGQSVPTLIQRLWDARFDLDEDDEAFVDELHQKRMTALKPRQLGRLQRCVRQLNIDG